MTGSNLLCEFITNPFEDEEEARELLSEIDHRPLSGADLERGLFCFQIAFYFLACLAITARIEDPSLQKTLIDRLHDRVRGFYACKKLRVQLCELVVSPAERDLSIAALCQPHDQSGGAGIDTAAATTMLALFDLVAAHRLREYVDAIGRSSRPGKLYLVAEQLLFHYGARTYHPRAIAVVADFLAVNYNKVSAIVASGSGAVDTPRTEDEEGFMPLPLTARMPDVAEKRPTKTYLAGMYVLRLVEDVGPIGGGDIIRYRYVLAVCDKRRSLPMCFVTLEDSSSVSNVLGVFEQSGSHSNYGTLRGRNLLQEFIGRGMSLIRYRFNLGEIKELVPRPQRQSRWAIKASC
jgi:hypothetical protein